MKKILTLDQLVKFCESNALHTFSSKDTGYTLSVQIPAEFKEEEISSDKGMLYCPIRICHTLLNRNGSHISEENMKRAMPSLKYRPFLAHIHQLDSGEWDFHSHDMEIVEDENGEEKINYIEKQIGCITADEPTLVYDEEMDKTYVTGMVAIPEEYTMGADILRKKKTSKVSCELNIESMVYNAKERYLDLIDFYFTGVTGLGRNKDGTEIGEGMLGSKVSLEDFSSNNNGLFSKVDKDTKIIELLESLNTKLDNFNINTIKEGGNTQVFEELLKKYEKTVEDITFDYEGLTDEELEAKFAEVFGDDTDGEGEGNEPDDTTPEDGNGETEKDDDIDDTPNDSESDPVVTETEACGDKKKKKKCSLSVDGTAKDFELSLSDIEDALYNLVNDTYEADGVWYGIEVFDTHVIMKDWWNNKNYKQSYERTDDTFALKGDRVEVFANWLTADEEASLAELRANYSLISEKLDKYELAEAEAQKSELLASKDYSSIADKAEFAEVSKDVSTYSVDELKSKLDEILLSYAKAGNLSFTSTEEVKKEVKVTRLPLNDGKAAKKSRYGSLFSKSN